MTGKIGLPTLKAFIAVVEQGGVSRAADDLKISQSAVSHHLKAIEAESEVPLFFRDGHKLTLTEHGQIYFIEVRDGLALLENARRKLNTNHARDFRLGVQYSFANHMIVPMWRALRDAFPNLTISFEPLAEEPGFNAQNLDLVISSWRLDGPFKHIRTHTTEWRPYCSPEMPEKDNWEAQAPLITFEDGTDWRHWGLDLDAQSDRLIRCTSAGTVVELAKQKAGVAICADPMVKFLKESGQLIALSEQSHALEWGQLHFCSNRQSLHSEQAQLMTGWILDTLRTSTK